jgi:prepilin-type N-terminal cleavage/methylation domain-containing protein
MKSNGQAGFSLVELLIVVVVVAVIAAMAVPAYQKGIAAAENGVVVSTMRTIASSQVAFYSQNNRFGRLAELNNAAGGRIGTPAPPSGLQRNHFIFEMVPVAPTDAELKSEYTIVATRTDTGGVEVYKYEVTQSGNIQRIIP